MKSSKEAYNNVIISDSEHSSIEGNALDESNNVVNGKQINLSRNLNLVDLGLDLRNGI